MASIVLGAAWLTIVVSCLGLLFREREDEAS